MQCSLRGCLQRGLKRIKDSDESEVGHFSSLISSGSSVVILTVMELLCVCLRGFPSLPSSSRFHTEDAIHHPTASVFCSKFPLSFFHRHPPRPQPRNVLQGKASHLSFLHYFCTNCIALQHTEATAAGNCDSRSLQRNASFTRIVP